MTTGSASSPRLQMLSTNERVKAELYIGVVGEPAYTVANDGV